MDGANGDDDAMEILNQAVARYNRSHLVSQHNCNAALEDQFVQRVMESRPKAAKDSLESIPNIDMTSDAPLDVSEQILTLKQELVRVRANAEWLYSLRRKCIAEHSELKAELELYKAEAAITRERLGPAGYKILTRYKLCKDAFATFKEQTYKLAGKPGQLLDELMKLMDKLDEDLKK